MRTIWKFFLPDYNAETAIMMPAAAVPLCVAEQNYCLMLWAQVESDNPLEMRRVTVAWTGCQLRAEPEDKYVGTVQMRSGVVLHVWMGP